MLMFGRRAASMLPSVSDDCEGPISCCCAGTLPVPTPATVFEIVADGKIHHVGGASL